MQLKPVVAKLLLRTWQPVIRLVFANLLPEHPRRLTWCYVPEGGSSTFGGDDE